MTVTCAAGMITGPTEREIQHGEEKEETLQNYPLLAKRVAHVLLNAALYGRKRILRSTQVQGWEFTMKVTAAVSSCTGIDRPEDKCKCAGGIVRTAIKSCLFSRRCSCL